MNLCVIPAKGTSCRLPGKNIRLFHGKPIIFYSIEAAQKSRLFDSIVVSTDSDEIATLVSKAGASVIWRPKEMTEDNVGTREVVKSAMSSLEDNGQHFDFVCCIYATAPMISVDDLVFGFDQLTGVGVSHAISIGYPPLQDAAQFYFSKAKAIRTDVEYFGHDTVPIMIQSERVCDINTVEDWTRAEQMYAALSKP